MHAMLHDRVLGISMVLNATARTPNIVNRKSCRIFSRDERNGTMLLTMLVHHLIKLKVKNSLPGRPQPIPIIRYNRNTITRPSMTISFMFFHHILLFNPLDLTRKSLAEPPSLSVLSTSRSSLSPLSSTLSMFSVMIPRTLSISPCTFLKASSCPLLVVPYSTINAFSCALYAAAP